LLALTSGMLLAFFSELLQKKLQKMLEVKLTF